ncbi:MAG: NHL repeat-containing protein [Actinomycetes bacterium]|jgi:sugar lactone lactonase YvrE|nr:NHL repeat-containing protein [Actinomycetes bacterium]
MSADKAGRTPPVDDAATGADGSAPAPSQPKRIYAGRVVERAADSNVNRRARILVSVLIVILAIVLLLACAYLAKVFDRDDSLEAPTALNGITWIRSVYAFGSDPSQLISPASCAVAPDGNSFWVTDQSRFRLVRFSWNGAFRELLTQDASGTAFNFPSDIDVAPDGWIYVVEQTYHHVNVYDPQMNLRQILEIPNPMSVDVNNEMVVVGARSGFVAWDRQGELIGYVGQRGNTDDSFDTINGVVLDDDSNVYVVDTYNCRLSKYDRAGDRVWMVGLGPAGNQGIDTRESDTEALAKEFPAMLQQPMGVCIDGSGRIIIIDGLDFSIAAFSPDDGSFIAKYGTFGEEDGQLAYSSDIDYCPENDYFVLTDTGNARAQIIKLPDSGGGTIANLRAGLDGPLSSCCIPIILLILLALLYLLWRWLRKRRQRQLEQYDLEQAGAVDVQGDTGEYDVSTASDSADVAADVAADDGADESDAGT